MGNAGSSGVPRDRHKSGETVPSSPSKEENQAFNFDKKPEHKVLSLQGSQEDEEPYFTKPVAREVQFEPPTRQRANTVSEGTTVSDKTPTVFRWEGGGKDVYISGTFSEWKTIPMVKSHGDFVTIIDLPEGEHQYKFYVDGEWRNDPGTKVVVNDIGTKNNEISVRKSDFEVFEALDKDSENAPGEMQKEYSQEIPANKPWEKVAGPPFLPPHLLQVILNKDTPLSCEPTLLPEPNHVMLNHLYALSIKEGVMVLSATHRYRKKYVTTLLYKPI
ncbi:PREDICTED: 5'-AMP-activated protein kinase subunit beta-1 [Nicrophorus vespilloides]|uniref:5'-AMP-activated protein kinase subunit beta-1 n=1 Tax=Nicrophorus vespilloides TaxID=110193 RepID=A0ABM1NA77_NICVS|nr:PREDICTED: 5'-AMP-activated protein kinase subunit beta-1 [Nicrophorus vespilloides]XP_017783727.1 PREDICTED: 5'-AMP-activated protein kinase subunit beta-1 [Nicrophorus vespilloides]